MIKRNNYVDEKIQQIVPFFFSLMQSDKTPNQSEHENAIHHC